MIDSDACLDYTLKAAKQAGAEAVDLLCICETARNVRVRHGAVEAIESAESLRISLRVLIGQRQAQVASTDLTPAACTKLAQQAVEMARIAPEDPFCGLADPTEICQTPPKLDINDSAVPNTPSLIHLAQETERAALAVPHVTQADEVVAEWSRTSINMRHSNGLAGQYDLSQHSIYASIIAGTGTAMERDYDYDVAVYGSDLRPASMIGRRAGERAARRLHARKMPTAVLPVVFAPRVAASLVRHLVNAIDGAAIARGTSFLKEALGKRIFSAGIMIHDNPHRHRGLRSRPFDAEGLAKTPRFLIEDGVLTGWLLDLRSARQLGLRSTADAGRTATSLPMPVASNIVCAAGTATPDELMHDIKTGFYVTDLIGMGVNNVTGDYSRGAAGFWIEDGRLTHPVNEMTIAGNLRDMFARLIPANDLEQRLETEAPTVRIDGMTVAGE